MPLPEAAVAAVTAVVDDVREAALPAGQRDVRWVRLDGLHLTLRFLGPTPDDRVAPTSAAVAAAAAAAAGPIDIELGGSGTFPPAGRPRTLWIGLVAGADAVGELAMSVEAALVGVGWPTVDRPFRPHLTLARSDGVAAGPLVAGRLAAAIADRTITCRLDRLGLFESVTGGGPARYLPVTLATMGASPSSTASVYHQGAPDPT